MSLQILSPGVQTTLQGAPRRGHRHLGVPWSGAADPLSLGLANSLVGNPPATLGLEITYGPIEIIAQQDLQLALVGAVSSAMIDQTPVRFNETLLIRSGQKLSIGTASMGARIYLAVLGGLHGEAFLGSGSTYLPAQIGGHQGRALRAGDVVQTPGGEKISARTLPPKLHPFMSHQWILHVCPGPEFNLLDENSRSQLSEQTFQVSARMDRMGIALAGHALQLSSSGKMKSSAVFPGTIQCPEDGKPFILAADAQTTGGYPRIAQIIRSDRHRLGQLRPGDQIKFQLVSPVEATDLLTRKMKSLRAWAPDIDIY